MLGLPNTKKTHKALIFLEKFSRTQGNLNYKKL